MMVEKKAIELTIISDSVIGGEESE